MKKVISVFLAALMLMSCFAVAASASKAVPGDGVCDCEVGVHVDGQSCTCCVDCPNPDKDKWTTCYGENGEFCCSDCRGIYPCGCNCECCARGDEDINDDDSQLDEIWGEKEQEAFVDGFQAVLKKISDFFDMVFDAIFEFLRLDEVLGRGDNPEA